MTTHLDTGGDNTAETNTADNITSTTHLAPQPAELHLPARDRHTWMLFTDWCTAHDERIDRADHRPLLTPIGRWGHTPLTATPLTARAVADITAAHLAGQAPRHIRPPSRKNPKATASQQNRLLSSRSATTTTNTESRPANTPPTPSAVSHLLSTRSKTAPTSSSPSCSNSSKAPCEDVQLQ